MLVMKLRSVDFIINEYSILYKYRLEVTTVYILLEL